MEEQKLTRSGKNFKPTTVYAIDTDDDPEEIDISTEQVHNSRKSSAKKAKGATG